MWQLARQRPDLLHNAATAMISLKAHDARHMVAYLLQHPDVTVQESVDRVIESKSVTERQYHVIAILDEGSFAKLRKKAAAESLSPDELVTRVVRSWLEQGD